MRLLKEQELLNKDPIIAPDGYIPNSVIRKKLKKRDVPLKQEKPFKLKPIPKVNPQHMPPWWDMQTEEDMEETATSVPLEYRVMKWDDTPSPTPRSVISSVSSVSLESLVESPVKKYIAEGRSKTISPKSPKSKSEQKMASKPKSRNEVTPVDNVKLMVAANNKNLKAKKSGWDDDHPPSDDDTEMSAMQRRYSNQQRTLSVDLESDIRPKPSTLGYKVVSPSMLVLNPLKKGEGFGKMTGFVQKDLEAYSPESLRRRRLGERTDTRETREKSMKLTDYAVDEDSSAIHVIKDTKRPVKCLTNLMHHAIIRQLLEEEWFPEMEPDFEYKDILRNLLSVLDENKPGIFGSACNYITSLFRELGLSDEQLNMIIGELAVYLRSEDPSIRKHVIRTLQTLGEGRTDVLIMVLKLLVDEEESVREAAADCIRVLTGATDKETLLNILEALGITEGFYNSKADEAFTLALLAERFAEHEDPEHFNRIKNWIQGTTPGIYDDKEDDSLQDGMRSGKEHSFMSEGKSVIDLCDTSGRNTMYADLPTTPGSFSDTDELILSRGVSMLDAKSGGMKSEKSRYNARLDLLERAGASVIPCDRWQQPTPLSDIMGNDAFMMEDRQTPFMEDPVLNFPNESFMSLDEAPVLSKEKSDVSVTRHSSTKSLKDLLLKERTLTDLSQVGPLPNFLPRDNSGRNFDDVSTDSAFESAVSVSEYANSHFSEKGTTDQYSSKHSQMSEENNMFDVEQVSHLEYEGKREGALISRSKKEAALTPRSKKDGTLTPRSKQDGALTPRSKQDGALTPRSKATESTLKNKMKDMDGFSTISDRSSSSRKSRRSGRHVEDTQPAAPGIGAPLDIRFTPKDHHLYQYYDNQLGTSPGPVPPSVSKLKESENVREAVPDKDSGYSGQTISDIPSSQVTGSSLSTQELGVSRDISEFSHGKLGVSRDMSEVSHGKLGVSGEFSHGKLGVSRDMSEFSHGKPFARGYPRAALSPVKSEPASPPPKSGPHTPKDWRRFFELVPNAQERKQMELIRREMEAGKLKHHTLPPISYFAEDLPMLPGEAGTRLLQTVRVGEKMQAPGDGRHRIESVPGKLAVHTQNEDAGLSNFGILQMQWTTGVPSVRDRLHPPQRIAQHRNQAMIQEESLLNSANSYNRLRHGLSEEELNLPYIDTASPSMTKRQSADQYEWEYPLPPPPAKESRTQVPMIRRDHENYCKYYHLLKKKLHLYTSKQKERSQHLPELLVKRLREQGQDEKSAAKSRKQTSLTKIDSSLLFPPIKLGQLVKIC